VSNKADAGQCGQERPECLACIKAGWRCPGYTKRWKFVDESEQLRSSYQRKKYILEDVYDAEIASSTHVEDPGKPSHALTQQFYQTPVYRPLESTQADRTRMQFCYILDEPRMRSTFPVKSHGSFYTMIPTRLGYSGLLDNSVTCLCSCYIDRLRNNFHTSQSTLRLFSRSLHMLRESLELSEARIASETICASIILQLCELTINDATHWSSLCQGTSLLIQESGPARFEKPFERAMLESQRAWFILQDASVGRNCFLAQPEWRRLLKSPSPLDASSSSSNQASLSLRTQLCGFLVEIPGLIRDASQVAMQIASGDTCPLRLTERREVIARQISSLKHDFGWWYCTRFSSLHSAYGTMKVVGPKQSSKEGFTDDDLLLAHVVDCVSISLLLRLDGLLSALMPQTQDGGTSSSQSERAVARRRQALNLSFEYVKDNSTVAVKPLQFGLQQLLPDLKH
jgi:hypothetical protein